ncbi:hypothetical protein B2H86_08820 [Clostridium botulinum]|nr:hypothetical protein B2H90_02925 [Clostridium botulinum]OSA75347.1 hypothetical protein B2H86_08820 [Clostridium botulinum]
MECIMYVIKNKRLKNYLYSLGLDYKTQKDKTGKQDYIYLFNDTEELRKAITFYTEFHKK